MKRRALLGSVGGLAALGLTGCLEAQGGEPTDAPIATDTRTGNGTPPDGDSTPTRSTTSATPPGTPPHDAPFPPERDDVDRVVWFREVSDSDGRLHLTHAASAVDLPGEASFTLHNNTDATFNTNFYNWALYRWEAERWYRVAPTMVNDPLMQLAPGESHTWTASLSDEDLQRVRFRSSGTEEISVGAVGGGHYAFAAEGWWDGQDATPSYEHKTVLGARFDLDGDQLSLVPSAAVTDTRRDGDTVVVTAENPRDSDGTPATYVLSHDDAASDPTPLVTEQVYRHWPLRDALAHAEDASEVRVETTTTVTPLFGVQSDENPAVTYDSETFQISAFEREG